MIATKTHSLILRRGLYKFISARGLLRLIQSLDPSSLRNLTTDGGTSRRLASAARRPPSSIAPPRKQDWVPAAYRIGYGRNGKFRKTNKNDYYRNKPRGRVIDDNKSNSIEALVSENRVSQKKEMEDWLFKLHRDLMRLGPEYRKLLHSEDQADDHNANLLGTVDKKLLLSANNDIFEKQVTTVLQSIHESHSPVNPVSFHNSEPSFESLATVLQQMCSICCKVSSLGDTRRATKMYSGLAELILLQLLNLVSDRNTMRLSLKQILRSTNSENERGGVSGWLKSFAGSFLGTNHHDETTERDKLDRNVEATQSLFRQVVLTIASTPKVEDDGTQVDMESTELNFDRRKEFESTAKHLLKLFGKVPEQWLQDDTSLVLPAVELLCRAGFLESARLCKQVYERYPEGGSVRFEFVLKSYLEAAQKQNSVKRKREIVDEMLETLNTQWAAESSIDENARLREVPVALDCLSMAGMKADESYCVKAEDLARQSLGESGYEKLHLAVWSLQVDPENFVLLPLLNSLAHVFAASLLPDRVTLAKRMLKYIMELNNHGAMRCECPTIDAFDAVLSGIVKQTEGQKEKDIDRAEGEANIDFAMEVLEHLQRRNGKKSFPTELTHMTLFRLLERVKPSNLAELGEQLLSRFESIQFLSKSSQSNSLTLSTYHRVMRYWLTVVSNPGKDSATSRVACERAFRILQYLELSSTPAVLSDRALVNLEYDGLYVLSLRPVEKTYMLVMDICVKTSRTSDFDKAASVALKVAQKMKKKKLKIDEKEVTAKLQHCCSRLPDNSRTREAIDAWLHDFVDLSRSECA